MKKIEKELKAAWENGYSKSISNSAVIKCFDRYLVLQLFGNVIGVKDLRTNRTFFTLAGWNTVTTRSRIRNVLGIQIGTQAGVLKYYGKDSHGEYKRTKVIFSGDWHELVADENNISNVETVEKVYRSEDIFKLCYNSTLPDNESIADRIMGYANDCYKLVN